METGSTDGGAVDGGNWITENALLCVVTDERVPLVNGATSSGSVIGNSRFADDANPPKSLLSGGEHGLEGEYTISGGAESDLTWRAGPRG